jgi:raffinose/stachyose/melibiose transport system permease protein
MGKDKVVISSTSKRRKKNLKKKLFPWLLVLPALLLNIFVVGAPTIGTLLMSLTDWDGFRKPNFIGLENYKTLLHDTSFYMALGNNIKWMLYFITVPILFALIVAVIVSKVKKGQMAYRSIFFIPNVVSTIVSAKIWSLIYNPFFGINSLLAKIGIQNFPVLLGNQAIALFSVAFVDSWRYWGFLMVLFLTSLQQTDKSLEEAAMIDGANKVRIFWNIILPQIRPTVMLILMLTMIWSFGAFDYVYVMTGGGPGHATELIATYMYKLALQDQAPGYASTIALAMALFSGAIMGIFGILRKLGWDI